METDRNAGSVVDHPRPGDGIRLNGGGLSGYQEVQQNIPNAEAGERAEPQGLADGVSPFGKPTECARADVSVTCTESTTSENPITSTVRIRLILPGEPQDDYPACADIGGIGFGDPNEIRGMILPHCAFRP